MTSNKLQGRDVLFSSKSNDHITPPDLFKKLTAVFNFDLDPCASQNFKQWAVGSNYDVNGLVLPWDVNTFINPPYSEISGWVEKTIDEYVHSNRGLHYVMLLPSRTDRLWFNRVADYATAICFIKGRLRFFEWDKENEALVQQKSSAPFPSLLAIFAAESRITADMRKVLESLGCIWYIRSTVDWPGPLSWQDLKAY